MNYQLISVENTDKDKLYKLLQFALYDGSNYIDNDKMITLIFNILGLITILKMKIDMLIL